MLTIEERLGGPVLHRCADFFAHAIAYYKVAHSDADHGDSDEGADGTDKLANNGAYEADAPTCATEVQVQCNVSALDEFVNATCYNATDYEGFDEPEFSGVCLCDFGNCILLSSDNGNGPAVFARGIVGGISVLLVAAAVFFCCAAARRRERKMQKWQSR